MEHNCITYPVGLNAWLNSFNIFINDAFLFVKNSTLIIMLTLTRSFLVKIRVDLKNLQTDFCELKQWFYYKFLISNLQKCDVITLGNGNNHFNFVFNDIIIKNSSFG